MTPREKRTILAAAIIVAVSVVVLRVIPAGVRRYADLRARARLANAMLERARATTAAEPVLRDSLAGRARRLVALAPSLLAGASPAEASAELASLVGGAATLRHVRLLEQESRPDSAASVFTRISLRVNAEGDIAGLASWIATLEEGQRLLRVRELTISAPDAAGTTNPAERLRADVVIDGWAAPRGTR